MSYNTVLFVVLFISTSTCFFWPKYKTCLETHHFWRPYSGYIPEDAYVAAIDRDREEKYIARRVGPNNRSWYSVETVSRSHIVTMQFKARYEILCVIKPHNGFGWRSTSEGDLQTKMSDCCLVHGASGYYDGKGWVTYIGRTYFREKYYVGTVTNSRWWQILAPSSFEFYDNKGNRYGQQDNFEVLAYDCCTREYCSINPADCCFDRY